MSYIWGTIIGLYFVPCAMPFVCGALALLLIWYVRRRGWW